MKRSYATLACTVLMMLAGLSIFAQGTHTQPESAMHQAIDAKGRTVSIEHEIDTILIPGRAAVMPADALYLFEEAHAIKVSMSKTNQGLGDFFDILIPEEQQQPRLSQQISLEQIIAQNPSLVITKTNNYEAITDKLDPFKIPVFYMHLESSQQWKDEILQLGTLLGNVRRSEEINLFYSNRERVVEHTLQQITGNEKPRVLVMQVALSEGTTSFSVAPSSWIQTEMVQRAAGIPVWVESSLMDNAWKKVSFEQIAAWNPDYIYLISYRSSPKSFIDAIYDSDQWNALFAVQQNRVKAIPADFMSYGQPDSRWILALEFLAADLHPDKFPLFSMEERIVSFYEDLYQITDADILNIILEAYREYSL